MENPSIVANKYDNTLDELGTDLQKYLTDVICEAAQASDLETFVRRSMYVHDQNKQSFAILSRDALADGATEQYVKKQKQILAENNIKILKDKRLDSKAIDKMLNLRLDEIDQNKKDRYFGDEDEYLKDCIKNHIDLAGAINTFRYQGKNIPAFENSLRRLQIRYGGYDSKAKWKILKQASDLRNTYIGHSTPGLFENMSVQTYIDSIKQLKDTAGLFVTAQSKNKCEEFRKKCDKEIAAANLTVTFKEITEMFPDVGEDWFITTRISTDFDQETGILYFHTIDEVKECYNVSRTWINVELEKQEDEFNSQLADKENEFNSQLADKENEFKSKLESVNKEHEIQLKEAEADKKVAAAEAVKSREEAIYSNFVSLIKKIVMSDGTVSDPDPTESAVSMPGEDLRKQAAAGLEKYVIPKMPLMSNYRIGHISAEQIGEICEYCNVFTDYSAWMDPECRKYIINVLIPALNKKNRTLIIDPYTRIKLYQLEMNTDHAEKAYVQAKKARIAMHELHVRKQVTYIGMGSVYPNFQDYMVSVAESNQDKRFAVLCQDKNTTRELMQCKYDNILPLYYTGNNIKVLREFSSALKMTHAQYLIFDDMSDSEEDDFETEEDIPEEETEDMASGEFDDLGSETGEDPGESKTESGADVSEETEEEPVPDENSAEAAQPEPSVKEQAAEKAQKAPAKAKKAAKKNKQDTVLFRQTDSVIKETNELLPLSAEVSKGDVLKSSKYGDIKILKELGRGGEGIVYTTDQEGIVAKIYFRNRLTKNRFEKVDLMIKNDPQLPELCWPLDLLYNQKDEYVGFLMPLADQKYIEFGLSVFALQKSAVRQSAESGMNTWNRKSLVDLCAAVSSLFSKMMKKGIIMGDVNPKNLLLNPFNETHTDFIVVDCDSFQLGSYPCPVGTQAFTSPEVYKRLHTDKPVFGEFLRTKTDEEYSLATLLFKILMFNQSPFAGKGETDYQKAQKEYRFSFRSENTEGENTPDGPYRLIWNNTPKYIRDYFVQVFTGGKTVNAGTWENSFRRYKNGIDKGIYTADLIPNRYWDTPDRQYTVDFTCEECGVKTNMPKGRYEANQRKHMKQLCNSCRNSMFKLRSEMITLTCDECNKEFQIDKYTATMKSRDKEQNNKKILCDECISLLRQQVEITCTGCGKTVTRNALNSQRINRSRFLCKECRETVLEPCDRCGNLVEIQQGRLNQIRRDNRGVLCEDCRDRRYR